MADFFEDNKETRDDSKEVQKIKLDDGEYTPDELKELVKYGKLGKEVETKHNTKLDRLMPEYTKSTQKVKELEETIAQIRGELESTKRKPDTEGELTPEQKAAAIKQAEELGIITEKNADKMLNKLVDERVNSILAGRDLLGEVKQAAKWAKDEYGIEASSEDILTYMQENGFRDPKKALKDRFEEQIDKAKQTKWLDSKAPEFRTLSQHSVKKEPLSPDFKDRKKVREMAMQQIMGGNK